MHNYVRLSRWMRDLVILEGGLLFSMLLELLPVAGSVAVAAAVADVCCFTLRRLLSLALVSELQ